MSKENLHQQVKLGAEKYMTQVPALSSIKEL